MIRQATDKDIDAIMQVTKACAKDVRSKDIFQWNEHYPIRNAFGQDAIRNELYILEIEKSITGSICIATLMGQKYQNVNWSAPNLNNFYIHRLAIHPEQQGKNYALKLMDFAENKARNKDGISVRLDSFSQNQRNQKFYELRATKNVVKFIFPNRVNIHFIIMN